MLIISPRWVLRSMVNSAMIKSIGMIRIEMPSEASLPVKQQGRSAEVFAIS
jgi:hypothetical protein